LSYASLEALRGTVSVSKAPLQPLPGGYFKVPTAMIPLIPEDALVSTVEMMCYFCTAVGVLLTCVFAPRR
jgi:hypothetical protein